MWNWDKICEGFKVCKNVYEKVFLKFLNGIEKSVVVEFSRCVFNFF